MIQQKDFYPTFCLATKIKKKKFGKHEFKKN